MEKIDIIKSITERCGGDIYLGVVGAVRTGKSTFIKKFMESLVIPNISDEYEKLYNNFGFSESDFLKFNQNAIESAFLSVEEKEELLKTYHPDYKEEQSSEYSAEMMERAIEHNDIVIEECGDSDIRERAIWNAMVCCKNMNRNDEALKYAGMFPDCEPITRSRAMEMCLQGEDLAEHRQKEAYRKLCSFCECLSRIYWFATGKDSRLVYPLEDEVCSCIENNPEHPNSYNTKSEDGKCIP